jgi:hypothetical protein
MRSRVVHRSLLVSLVAAAPFALACGAPSSSTSTTASSGAITNVPQTPTIKNQAIGNCWIYATGSWAESLHKIAGAGDFNTSESYWTYLDWFQKITGGSITGKTIAEGGSFSDSAGLIQSYGIMAEGDFIPGDVGGDETSSAQGNAETAINASLATGALSTSDARSNTATVRSELDKAFGLTPDVSAMLTQAFGADLSQTLSAGTANVSGTKIIDPSTFAVAYTSGPGTQASAKTLLDATNDWQTVSYDPSNHRAFEARFQQALADEQPVVMSWFVDFNYLDNQGRFILDPAHLKTPGSGGGHMVVMEDYQIEGVPGFGTLPAGTLVTDPNALAAALDPSATIDFIRIKNSWGTTPPDLTSMPGYFDLYTNYLETSITQCDENTPPLADGGIDLSQCSQGIPFEDVTLPPGY